MPDFLPGALAAVGWSDRVLALFAALDDPSLEPARVVRVQRSACEAVFADGGGRRLHAAPLPAVGDWIAVAVPGAGAGAGAATGAVGAGAGAGASVHAVLARWSSLTRVDPSGLTTQVLAANVDVVIITAPADRLHAARVERELAVAWDSGAQPIVVVTKCDLMPDSTEGALTGRLVGVDVLLSSATTGRGVDQIRARLAPSRTAVLLGPSGAGKSTLANALLGIDRFTTADVRDGDRRGRHTTTSRQLVAVPGGGVLIDTPGLRSLGLGGDVDVEQAFPDIESLGARCRFSDCRHQGEPDCAVLAASAEGTLDPARLASFRKLEREVAAEARRVDPRLRRAELSMWKARTKEARIRARRRD